MKRKRNTLLVSIFGFVVLLIGAAMPFAYWMNYTERYGSVGIIGGADVPPTYWFGLYALFSGLPMALVVVGITLLLSSAFYLAFSKTVKAHCKIKTSAISLGGAITRLPFRTAVTCSRLKVFCSMAREE